MNWEMEFVKAINNENAYDFICYHYCEMSKESLKNILLECIYALYNEGDLSSVANEIESLYGEE